MKLHHLFVSAMIGAAATAGFAQPNRILSRIDNSQTFALPGRVHPLATAANDAGAVDSSFPLPYITMLLHPTAAQQTSLQQLLQDQQNPASPSYHQWLTPEQYADRFGVSSSDAAQIVAWLESQGFQVDPVSRSRTFITFTGTASQVQAAFGTSLHYYKVNGETHYANSTDLTIPAALSPLVAGFRGLNSFRLKPNLVKAKPNWTLGPGDHVIAPDDFATIYDITPMYTAGTSGSGQKIAIMGQSQVKSSDITNFWNTFGLTSVKLVQTLATPRDNPGIVQGDVDESSLDTEWAGAVARDATIEFIYSGQDVGVWNSAMYAVDNAVAPVISMSYGECEMFDLIDVPSYRQTVQQANAEGITWVAAAGDAGAAACDAGSVVAEGGLAVNEPASIPEVTSMGGTSVSNAGSYWTSGNTSTDGSAKGYMPEIAWNESAPNGSILGTGGGASMYFPQPSWQTNGGVPADGWRHVPDLAFNASVYVVPYYVYCSVCEAASGGVEDVGGTSAATPTMAGVVALLNQYLKTSGLGNINPTIYKLFQAAPGAFHNNITGNNIVACAYGSPGCNNGLEGYTITGTGYSSVVGLGSVDVTKLIQNWSTAAPTGAVVVGSIDQNPVYQGFAESCGSSSQWNFQLTVTEEGGFATTLTGFSINGTDYSSQIGAIFGTSAIPARGSISGCFSLSSVNVPANEVFNFSGPTWTTSLSIPFQGPQTQLAVGGASNAASGQQTFAPGMIMSVYGAALGTLSQAASTIPLPEYMAGFEAGICPVSCQTGAYYPVPLYYVGPNQVNLQIPYEVTGAADLNLGNPYALTDYYFTVQPAAPGIFMLEDGSGNVNPSQAVSPGGTGTVYVTGVGAVTHNPGDGAAPTGSEVPKPTQAVTVTVGGVTAQTSYVAIPSWSVGVLQINFTIPSSTPTGRQPVVVTIGTTASLPAFITVQ
jgi:uncharacterized protein (TIGR03437 family)